MLPLTQIDTFTHFLRHNLAISSFLLLVQSRQHVPELSVKQWHAIFGSGMLPNISTGNIDNANYTRQILTERRCL